MLTYQNATTLTERDCIETTFGEIKFTAPRIEDREMLERLQELIKLRGVKATTIFISEIVDALNKEKGRINIKL